MFKAMDLCVSCRYEYLIVWLIYIIKCMFLDVYLHEIPLCVFFNWDVAVAKRSARVDLEGRKNKKLIFNIFQAINFWIFFCSNQAHR